MPGKRQKTGGASWQARVGRLLRQDAPKTAQPDAAAADHPKKRKRADDDDGPEPRPVDPENLDPAVIARRKRELFKTEDKSTQLFVGNLPFEVSETELKERFEVFGRVRLVLIVKDKLTGRPTGSAFVHFRAPGGAQKALAEGKTQQELADLEGGQRGKSAQAHTRKQQKRDIFRGKTDSGTAFEGIMFNGRLLSVKPAVSKKEASSLTRQAEKQHEKEETADPRNLKLLEEGNVLSNTPAAVGLTERRLQLLHQRYQLRKKKLKDPNFFVSPTRLCLRDIPPETDEKALKQLVHKTIRAYTQKHPEAAPTETSRKNPFIKQLRIAMDPNSHVSRGFGFVEFREHAIALHVLRALNNNPSIFEGRRLDVEFAVESVHALQKLKRITDKGRERNRVMRDLSAKGEDPKEGWRAMQDEKSEQQEAAKAKRKKEFEKHKKFMRYSGRKN
ncbi:Nucleolar protein 4 [Diplonema papillatum]|nr:Nucleolar protein 4 [Diplonema papillatum]